QAAWKDSSRLTADASRVSADCCWMRDSSRTQSRCGARGAVMIPTTSTAVAKRSRHGERQMRTRHTTARPRKAPREKVKMAETIEAPKAILKMYLSHHLSSSRERERRRGRIMQKVGPMPFASEKEAMSGPKMRPPSEAAPAASVYPPPPPVR